MLAPSDHEVFAAVFYSIRGRELAGRIRTLEPCIFSAEAAWHLARSEHHMTRTRDRAAGRVALAFHRLASGFHFACASSLVAKLEPRAARPPAPAAPIVRAEDEDAFAWRESFEEWKRENAAYKSSIAREREEWIREQARRDQDEIQGTGAEPAELVAKAVEEHQAAELVGDPPPAGDAVAELVAEVLAGPPDAGQQETAEFPAYTGAPQTGE